MELQRLLSPAGLPLKGNRRDAIRQLDFGQHADWLGYRICQGQRGHRDTYRRQVVEPAGGETGPGPCGAGGADLRHGDHRGVGGPARRLLRARGPPGSLWPRWCRWPASRRSRRSPLPRSSTRYGSGQTAASTIFGTSSACGWPAGRGVGLKITGPRGFDEDLAAPIERRWPVASGRPGPQFTLYTDGSCLGSRGIGGWAFILEGPTAGERICRADSHPATTNNRMELTAVSARLGGPAGAGPGSYRHRLPLRA